MIITIDGPAGSGKSTIAQLVANAIPCDYLNSGLLYRAASYILITYYKFTLDNLVTVTEDVLTQIFKDNKFVYHYTSNMGPKVLFNNLDITSLLKSYEIDKASSILSQNPFVRNIVLDYQRQYAKNNSIIIDGRDTGSVVFPNADFKFFLTASLLVRAQRWCDSQNSMDKKFTIEECSNIIKIRDDRDINRKLSPLVVPKGAVIIDTSELSIGQVLELVLSYIK